MVGRIMSCWTAAGARSWSAGGTSCWCGPTPRPSGPPQHLGGGGHDLVQLRIKLLAVQLLVIGGILLQRLGVEPPRRVPRQGDGPGVPEDGGRKRRGDHVVGGDDHVIVRAAALQQGVERLVALSGLVSTLLFLSVLALLVLNNVREIRQERRMDRQEVPRMPVASSNWAMRSSSMYSPQEHTLTTGWE